MKQHSLLRRYLRCLRTAITALGIACLLGACQSTGEKQQDSLYQSELNRAIAQNQTLPAEQQPANPIPEPDLDQELLQLSVGEVPEKRFNIAADQVSAQQFFRDLVDATGVNIVVDPQLSGTITLTMNRVTIQEALHAISDSYGFAFEKTSYGYKILANRLMTRLFDLNYLNVNRTGTSDTGITGSQISSQGQQSSQVTTRYEADFWQTLEHTLKIILDDRPGRTLVINPQTGVVVVKGNPEELRSVESFIRRAERSLQKQVIIEARVVEITLSEQFQSGINWNTFASDADRALSDTAASSLEGSALSGINSIGGVFNLNVNSGDFSALIQLLDHQGSVQVLSSPRISTVNNQKAVIKVGTDEFFVTNIDQGGGEYDEPPEVELTPFFSGIALDVTPQIGDNNTIILHVHPSVTEVEEKTKVINVGNEDFTLPLASSTIRETDSIIKARSGQIVVIGGLLQNRKSESGTGVPLLGKVPLVKSLFRQQRRASEKSELVILLQPIITDDELWNRRLQEAGKTMTY